MVLTGYILRVEGDLAPEQIIAPAHAAAGDPALLAAYCLEAVDPRIADIAREGDILVVDGNFGGGPTAEIAVLALQALGFAAVVSAGVEQDLADMAAIYGLPVLVQPAAAAALPAGALLRIDLERGSLERQPTGARWVCDPLPLTALAAVRRAQLLARMRRIVEQEGYAE